MHDYKPEQAALRRYTEQTRTAVHQGFAALDEQRLALDARLAAKPEEREAYDVLNTQTFTATPTAANTLGPQWHFDSLREVLAVRFNSSQPNEPLAKQAHFSDTMELGLER